jgi:hypothetical protein
MLHSKSGELVAVGFNRLVIGDRGPYIEFIEDHLVNYHMPDDQLWRIESCRKGKAFYHEYRTNKDNVKIYHQQRLVDYADYRYNLYYISPYELYTEDRANRDILKIMFKEI